jgi:hypothetical protein
VCVLSYALPARPDPLPISPDCSIFSPTGYMLPIPFLMVV